MPAFTYTRFPLGLLKYILSGAVIRLSWCMVDTLSFVRRPTKSSTSSKVKDAGGCGPLAPPTKLRGRRLWRPFFCLTALTIAPSCTVTARPQTCNFAQSKPVRPSFREMVTPLHVVPITMPTSLAFPFQQTTGSSINVANATATNITAASASPIRDTRGDRSRSRRGGI